MTHESVNWKTINNTLYYLVVESYRSTVLIFWMENWRFSYRIRNVNTSVHVLDTILVACNNPVRLDKIHRRMECISHDHYHGAYVVDAASIEALIKVVKTTVDEYYCQDYVDLVNSDFRLCHCLHFLWHCLCYCCYYCFHCYYYFYLNSVTDVNDEHCLYDSRASYLLCHYLCLNQATMMTNYFLQHFDYYRSNWLSIVPFYYINQHRVWFNQWNVFLLLSLNFENDFLFLFFSFSFYW